MADAMSAISLGSFGFNVSNKIATVLNSPNGLIEGIANLCLRTVRTFFFNLKSDGLPALASPEGNPVQ